MIPPLTELPEHYDWPWGFTLALAWGFAFLVFNDAQAILTALVLTLGVWLCARGE